MHLIAPNLKHETFVQIQRFDSRVSQNKSSPFLKTFYCQNTIDIDDNFGHEYGPETCFLEQIRKMT